MVPNAEQGYVRMEIAAKGSEKFSAEISIDGKSVGECGWAVNVTLDHCANIGAITSIGSSSGNLIGKPNAYTITDCYGFGIVSGGSNGVLIGAVNDGVTGTSTGNKYLNGNQAGTIGAEEQGLVATVAEAVELLEAYYADLTFEIVDGAIVIRPAA